MANEIVGVSVPRKEGIAKVTGRSQYVDDLTMPGMWHGTTVRSTIPRGRIVAIRFNPTIDWDQYAVVSARDIPGKNMVAMFMEDQPLLADGFVNHPEEPILLIAHPDLNQLGAALAAIEIEYEPLPAVLTIAESEAEEHIIWGEDNTFKRFCIEKGDVDSVWASAAHIVEGEYETGAQEQLYIEPNGFVASATLDEVTVWGSLQCPYYVHRALKEIFALLDDKVRVVQTETGGAFGGKEEYPSVIAGHAALLSLKCGHPVKIVYDRLEDMVATTKRHPSRTRIKAAVDAEGMLLGAEIEFAIDGGAYMTLSPTVLSRGTIHAAGPYLWPAIRVKSRAFATNSPPSGAFRGFGAPQSLFALERHMDQIAKVVGLAPEELRRRNFLVEGQTTATGQVIKSPVDMAGMMDRALAESDYYAKKKRFALGNPGSSIKRGIGIASFMHGSGFTGSGERFLNSLVALEADLSGVVRVLVSSSEFGQGTNTILCQIAAEALGAEYEGVEIAQPDTSVVPNSGPTVASRTAMIVGKLVESAARDLRSELIKGGFLCSECLRSDFKSACAAYVKANGPARFERRYDGPKDVYWDDVKYSGDAYPAYSWAVYVAEVAVDTTTYIPEVTNFYAMQEAGTIINPVLAAGQVEGGVAQAIGYALYEKVVWKDGRMANGQMTNYIMPTSADIPPIHVFFEEVPCEHGGYGAKGIGELPMDGPGPAILNAIEDATGVSFNHIPLMPEDICEKLSILGRVGVAI